MKVEDVKVAGVLGCGVMGFGISVLLLNKGLKVIVLEKDKEGLERGREYIMRFYKGGIKRGKMKEEEMEERISRLKLTLNYEDFVDVDVVFEAVYENISIKHQVLRNVESMVRKTTPIFTNTSSIPVIEISSILENPQRFLGFHFFNPPVVMKLVEVIPSLKTSPQYVDFAVELAKFLGKEPVIVEDKPGFVGNALLVPFILEAIRMEERGIAKREDIDKACKFGLGHPMGPFELADFMGLDIILNIADNVFERTKDERFASPPTLRELVSAGYLGRKTGRGFYDYRKPTVFGVD